MVNESNEPKKRGRPRNPAIDEELIGKIEEIEKERKMGVADAVRVLIRRDPAYAKYQPAALETRYYEALRKRKKVDMDILEPSR
jgi:hypothetical protein